MIEQLMADHNTDMAATATIPVSTTNHDVAVGAIATTVVSMNVSHLEVNEEDFVLNGTPPLSTYNRYTCLQIDPIIEPAVCEIESAKVIQTTSHPPNPNQCSCLPAWECQ
jgi:hypothetical protein